jgi:uncharacterized protein
MGTNSRLIVQQESADNLHSELNLIVKVTNRCQFRCLYCFVEESVRSFQMSTEILETVIRKALSQGKYSVINFIFHGGEPLLRGVHFFKKIVGLQKKYAKEVPYTNSVQTNGALLDDKSIHFLKDNSFMIGLSLDGDRELNDMGRLSFSGLSTYDVTTERMLKLQSTGVPVGAIATIHKGNVFFPERIYNEFKSKKFNLKLCPLEFSGRAKSFEKNLRISPDEYGSFLSSLLMLWFNDKTSQEINVEPLKSMFTSIINPKAVRRQCVWINRCHRFFIAVSPNGDLYPCGLYQGYSDYMYGNINKMTFEDVVHTRTWDKLEKRVEHLRRECNSCLFYERCFGGCPFNALANRGNIMSRDYYCESFKVVFTKMVSLLSYLSKDLSTK